MLCFLYIFVSYNSILQNRVVQGRKKYSIHIRFALKGLLIFLLYFFFQGHSHSSSLCSFSCFCLLSATYILYAIGRHICEFLYVILGLKSSLGKFLRTGQIGSDGTEKYGRFGKLFFSFWENLLFKTSVPFVPSVLYPFYYSLSCSFFV